MKNNTPTTTKDHGSKGIRLFDKLGDKEDRRYVLAVMRQVVNKDKRVVRGLGN